MLKEVEESTRPIPPLVKIKTGVKAKSQKGMEYPKEVDYFVINPVSPVTDPQGNPLKDENGKPVMKVNKHAERLIRKLGCEKPRELEVVFPTDNLDLIIPIMRYEWKGKKNGPSKLVCKGDGRYAQYRGELAVPLLAMDLIQPPLYNEGEGWNRVCNPETCPSAQSFNGKAPLCSKNLTIKALMPDVFSFGHVTISTGSKRAIDNVYLTLKHMKNPATLKRLGLKSIAGIPMLLTREAKANKDANGFNHVINITINEDRLEEELKMQLEGAPSTFMIAEDAEALMMIENSEKDAPDYDLLPQSTHSQPQSGDHVIDANTGEILAIAENSVPPIMIQEETELTIRQDWLNTNPDLNTLFNKLGSLTGKFVTVKKKELTLQKFETVEMARDYLEKKIVELESKTTDA